MEVKSGVYQIVQKDTGHVYVGSSINIDKRWKQHISNLKRQVHFNSKLQADVNQYGIESLEFSILEVLECDSIILNERERFWQSSTNSKYGYNAKEVSRAKSSVRPKRPNIHSIYISTKLWIDAKRKSRDYKLSFIISRLLEMWLNGEVKITIGSMRSLEDES